MTIIPDDKFDPLMNAFDEHIAASITDFATRHYLVLAESERGFAESEIRQFAVNFLIWRLDVWPEAITDLENHMPAAKVTPGGGGIN